MNCRKKKTTVKMVKKKRVQLEHPKYEDMIIEAIKQLKDRKGASRIAIRNFIINNNEIDSNVKKVNLIIRNIYNTVNWGYFLGVFPQKKINYSS